MLYKSTRVIIHLVDGDTDFFYIVTGVLQGDSLVAYLLIICVDYIQRKSIDLIIEMALR